MKKNKITVINIKNKIFKALNNIFSELNFNIKSTTELNIKSIYTSLSIKLV